MSTNDKLSNYGFRMIAGKIIFMISRDNPLWNEKSKYAVGNAEYNPESDRITVRNGKKYKTLTLDEFIKKYKLDR